MTLPNEEVSLLVSTYAAFWLFFSIYQIADQIKKLAKDRKIKEEEEEEIIEKLNDQMAIFTELTSMKFFVLLCAVVVTVVFAIETFGYFLTYAYLPLEGMKQMLFYAAAVAMVLHNIIRIADFTKIVKRLNNEVSAKEIVKEMNAYTVPQRVFFIASNLATLFFSLQFMLYCMF